MLEPSERAVFAYLPLRLGSDIDLPLPSEQAVENLTDSLDLHCRIINIVINSILNALGLGIAGIDPIAALLLISAITANASSLKIKVFAITVFISTIATGVLFSVLGIKIIDQIKSGIPSGASSVWLYVNTVIIVAIIIWLVHKVRNKPSLETKRSRKKLSGGSVTFFLAALLFGVGAILDPTFVANISLAAQTENVVIMTIMHTIWITISQFMLFVLFVAYLLGKHKALVLKSKSLWDKHRNAFNRTVFGAGVLAVVALLIDSLSYLISGAYILSQYSG